MLEKYKAEAERLRSAAQSERDKAENLRGKSEDEADRILDDDAAEEQIVSSRMPA